MKLMYWEDFQVGERRALGSRTVTRAEMIAFAEQFDPQPFHLDEAAAQSSLFGGLIASGWHTASLCMRLMVEGILRNSASLGSPGVDELRWLKPVRPDDTLSLTSEVLEMTPSRKRPDRGNLRVRYELTNQRGEPVMTMIGLGMVGRRPVSP